MQVYDIVLDKNKKETTPHGSFDFPLAIYTTQISKNILKYIAWHWHEELQFCIVTNGIVDFFINNDVVTLPEGDGIFINVGQMHQARNHQNMDSSYICIDFHPNLLSGFLGSIINAKYVAPYLVPEAAAYCTFKHEHEWQEPILNQLLGIYAEYDQHNEGFELRIQILLLQIWQTLVNSFFSIAPQTEVSNWDLRIKKMIEYINGHYMEYFRLDGLADEISLSKSACCREFKKYVKCTISEYLLDYRLMKSTKLLLTTDDPMTSIAYQCGFGSTSYFIEKFKKKSGVTPLAYRKEKVKKPYEIA